MKKLFLRLAVAASLSLMALTAYAQTPAITSVSGTLESTNNYDLGFEFTLSTSGSLYALGTYDGGNGLSVSQEVGIFDVTSQLELADATISATPAGDGDSTGFVYTTSITDLNGFTGTLSAGTTYLIATNALNPYISDGGISFTTDPSVTVLESDYGAGQSFGFAGNEDNPNSLYAGPNFEFGTSVPEPSTSALLGLGALLLGVVVRTRRHAQRV